ncbi:MAG: polysaccharide biosynthesis/export family protein [Planctomycetes bacterium]|nr:polysaccharide biosynthesis/export family protein [Planctomycetota bacterium]
MSLPRILRLLAWFLLAGLVACGTYEDKRIRELLHEKGFGSRADGDATRENYVGGLDQVQFLLPPEVLLVPGLERLAELQVVQPINLDGTIHVPFVGPVYVLGKTEAELAALVRSQLRAAGLVADIDLEARIVVSQKFFFAVGEAKIPGRHLLTTDITLWDAMLYNVQWTPLANLGRIYLIRPDAEHPLVVDVNFREMLTTGLTTANIQLREHDLIYVPPTFLGMLARLLQRLLEPVGLAVRTVIGVAQAQSAYEVLSGDRDAVYFRF